MSEQLTQVEFREHLGSTFRVAIGPEQTLELMLDECNDLGSTARQEQFSLIFTGPLNLQLPQMTYTIEHEKLGSLLLFIVPIRRDESHFYYEAVFNYFKEPAEA